MGWAGYLPGLYGIVFFAVFGRVDFIYFQFYPSSLAGRAIATYTYQSSCAADSRLATLP